MHQVNIRLNDSLYDRLGHLAKQTNKTVSFYVKAAIEEYLDDLEDLHLAKQALREARGQATVSLQAVRQDLDLDD